MSCQRHGTISCSSVTLKVWADQCLGVKAVQVPATWTDLPP